eukprot:5916607-Ditylum_brightwellii.AAC.1
MSEIIANIEETDYNVQKKVEAILKIAPHSTREQLHSFTGMINHCHDMLQGCSELLAPLGALT